MRWLDLEGKPNDSHPELFVELELSPAGTDQLFEGAPVPLEQVIREGVKDMTLNRGEVFGPVQTKEGFHLIMIANDFGSERATAFTGSSL